jgi:glycosyltransferase involved in cell wall biosynthesis
MKSKPLVSVIVPTYNSAKYIQETIKSILKQTYTNIEIIVVDDGSTDDTREVLKPYITKNQISYIYQENKKQGAARNNGIRNSRGELIALLDADDLWLPEKLELQVQLFVHKEVGLVYAGIIKFNDKDSRIVKTSDFNRFFKGYVFDSLFDSDMCFIANSSAVIRKSCLAEMDCTNGTGPYWEDLSCASNEDYHLFLRLAKKFKVEYVPKHLVRYRLHDANSSKDKIKNLMATIVTIKNISSLYSIPAKMTRIKISRYYLAIGYNYRKTSKLKALNYYFKSMRYHIRFEHFRLIVVLFSPF